MSWPTDSGDTDWNAGANPFQPDNGGVKINPTNDSGGFRLDGNDTGFSADAGAGGGFAADTSNGFKADGGDGFAADTNGGDTWGAGATNGNHNDSSFNYEGEGGGDNACRNCGQTGHFARECTEPRKLMGECYNCGQVGHNKADCTNPRVERAFTGECRSCGKEGHMSRDCPDQAPMICRLCNGEGHRAVDCAAIRKDIFPKDTPDLDMTKAWDSLMQADAQKDMSEFKLFLFAYAKSLMHTEKALLKEEDEGDAEPDEDCTINLSELEVDFRAENRNVFFIAKEPQNLAANMTIVDLNGKINQKYVLNFSWSEKPRAKMYAAGWPSTPEENLERLKSCGLVIDRGVPLCGNCGKLGHIRKHCKEEQQERVSKQPIINCAICQQPGHRARDCTNERIDRNACRNCKKSGHKASECPAPKSAEGVECKRCGEMGHFARDCPQQPPARTCRNCNEEGHIAKDCDKPRSAANTTCRNCDEAGHMAKECPKPRDYSRIQCRNCGEYGHTPVRCKQPIKDENLGGDFGGGYGGGHDMTAASSATPIDAGNSDWNPTFQEPAAAGGW